MHAPRTVLALLLLPLALGVVAGEAHATSFVWVNPGDGRWDQSGNWNFPGYPRYLWDFAIFNQDGAFDVDASDPALTGAGGVLVAMGTVTLHTNTTFSGVLAVGTVGPVARLDLTGTVDGAGTHNVGAAGTLSLRPGSRLVSRSGELVGLNVASGGVLCGDQGAFDGHLLRNLGTVSPGLAPGAPGLLTLGQDLPAAYQQRETGLLEIDVAGPDPGTGYDQLRVVSANAPVELGGSLTVTFAPGFVPAPGARFDLVTAPELAGTFGTVLLPPDPPGLELSLVYEVDRVSLVVEGTAEPVDTAYRLDVQPGSCRNPVGVFKRGMIPAALLGEEGLDVHEVDLASLRLLGLAPERATFADVASPPGGEMEECTCGGDADGIDDILLRFSAPQVIALLGDTEGVHHVTLTGTLLDGTPFVAGDCLELVGGGSPNGRDQKISPQSTPGQQLQTVSYDLPVSGAVRLSVISVTGRLVTQLVVAEESAGTHQADWNAEGHASGVYFYRLESPAGITTRKFLLVR